MNPPTPQTLRRYHLSDRTWQKLFEAAGGVCALCHKPFKTRPVIDHCHKTHRVRGLIHPWCNKRLGDVQDDAEWCLLAAEYLEHPPADDVLTDQEGYVTLRPKKNRRTKPKEATP